MIKPMKLDRITAEIKKQGFKHVGLFNQEGEALIPFNNSKTTVADRMKQIALRMQASTLPEGLYYIQAKSSVHTTQIPEKYPIVKGNYLGDNAHPGMVVQHIAAMPAEDVYTPEQYIEVYRQLITCQLENEELERRLERALLRIEELETQTMSDGPEPNGWDRAATFLSDLLPTISPAFDKYMEQRDKQLRIEEAKVAIQYNQMQPIKQTGQHNRRPAPAAQQPAVHPAAEFVYSWGHQYGQDETYKELLNCFNTATDVNDFLLKISAIQVLDEEDEPIQLADMYNDFITQDYEPDED